MVTEDVAFSSPEARSFSKSLAPHGERDGVRGGLTGLSPGESELRYTVFQGESVMQDERSGVLKGTRTNGFPVNKRSLSLFTLFTPHYLRFVTEPINGLKNTTRSGPTNHWVT